MFAPLLTLLFLLLTLSFCRLTRFLHSLFYSLYPDYFKTRSHLFCLLTSFAVNLQPQPSLRPLRERSVFDLSGSPRKLENRVRGIATLVVIEFYFYAYGITIPHLVHSYCPLVFLSSFIYSIKNKSKYYNPSRLIHVEFIQNLK